MNWLRYTIINNASIATNNKLKEMHSLWLIAPEGWTTTLTLATKLPNGSFNQ